ncbi:unnamed protein product [Phaeothamnion confervicola]
MYGCLGFGGSRFCAKPIAALVTCKGRETLQRTVDIAQLQLGLDVIYGDTDSIMINTNSTDLAAVKTVGQSVRREVNKLYRSLELELDGVFKSMLLLKKKKYAALIELKGLDLVRRDWCPLSKDCGRFAVGRILSGEPRETVVDAIHDHVAALAAAVRAGTVPLEQFVITRGLNRAPHEYGNAAAEPHVQVALAMMKAGKPVSIGNHIPYVICDWRCRQHRGASAAPGGHAPVRRRAQAGCGVVPGTSGAAAARAPLRAHRGHQPRRARGEDGARPQQIRQLGRLWRRRRRKRRGRGRAVGIHADDAFVRRGPLPELRTAVGAVCRVRHGGRVPRAVRVGRQERASQVGGGAVVRAGLPGDRLRRGAARRAVRRRLLQRALPGADAGGAAASAAACGGLAGLRGRVMRPADAPARRARRRLPRARLPQSHAR